MKESPYRQLCNIAPRLQSTPLLAADQPAHVFSSTCPCVIDGIWCRWRKVGCRVRTKCEDQRWYTYLVSRNFRQFCGLHWHQLQTIAIECYLDRRWDRKDLRLSVWLCEPVKYNFYNFKYLSHSLKWADQMRVVESRTLQALCSTGNWKYDGLESRHNK